MNLTQSDRTFMKHFAIMIAMLAGFAVVFTIIGTLVWASLPRIGDQAQVQRAGTRITPVATVRTGSVTQAAAPAGSNASATTAAAGKEAVASGPYKYDAAKGKSMFDGTCAVCHQASGVGVPGTFPALKGNPAVNDADPASQIKTMLLGRHGTVIEGKTYSGVMPPFGGQFSNLQIADIANYERSSWGNHAKHIDPQDVAKIRANNK
jgi:mono/diheme cytochrome c family protein